MEAMISPHSSKPTYFEWDFEKLTEVESSNKPLDTESTQSSRTSSMYDISLFFILYYCIKIPLTNNRCLK